MKKTMDVGIFLKKADERVAKMLPQLFKKKVIRNLSQFFCIEKPLVDSALGTQVSAKYEATERDYDDICMLDFWSFGLPKHMRKGLWPFIFPNNLRITDKIYKVNLEKANRDSQIIDNIDESDK